MLCCHYIDPFLYIHCIVQISKDTTPVFSLEVLHFLFFSFFYRLTLNNSRKTCVRWKDGAKRPGITLRL